AHALRAAIESARGRSAALDATLETVERDSHLGGGILAGALSYRMFVFALPLAFFLVSGLGLVASALGVGAHRLVNSVGFAVVGLQVPHANARWTDLIPGSLFYAIGFTFIVIFNILILGEMLKSKSNTYGALGIAAGLLLAFFFVGRLIVGAAVLNATLYERR